MEDRGPTPQRPRHTKRKRPIEVTPNNNNNNNESFLPNRLRRKISPSRRSRARWAVAMLLPSLLLLVVRLELVLHEDYYFRDGTHSISAFILTTIISKPPLTPMLLNSDENNNNNNINNITNNITCTTNESSINKTLLLNPQVPKTLDLYGAASPIIRYLNVTIFSITTVILLIILVTNELWGTTRSPVNIITFLVAFIWGSCIAITEDLIALRIGCMLMLGICAGQLRYHWDCHEDKVQRRREVLSIRREQLYKIEMDRHQQRVSERRTVADGISNNGRLCGSGASGVDECRGSVGVLGGKTPQNGGNNSDNNIGNNNNNSQNKGVSSQGNMPISNNNINNNDNYTYGSSSVTDAAASGGSSFEDGHITRALGKHIPPNNNNINNINNNFYTHLSATQQHHPHLYPLSDIQRALWRRVGLTLLWTLGEVAGCLICVPQGHVFISVSWFGYLLVVILPIATYKISAFLSHILTLIFGTRVNISDASKLLLIYWIITTALSLAILTSGVLLFVSSWLPLLWNLQKLAGPYSMILEYVSYVSRHHQSSNPYKDVAEQYSEHISRTMRESQYFRH